MPISNKYKHGDKVVIYSDPLCIGKIITPDRIVAPSDKNWWRNQSFCYKTEHNWVLVKWENGQREILQETAVKPLPDAVRILYGKT